MLTLRKACKAQCMIYFTLINLFLLSTQIDVMWHRSRHRHITRRMHSMLGYVFYQNVFNSNLPRLVV